MKEQPEKYQLADLILMEMDGMLSDEQFEILQEKIRSNPAALRYYVEFMRLHATFSQPGETVFLGIGESDLSDISSALNAMARYERQALAVEEEKPEEPLRPKEVVKIEYKMPKSSVRTLIFSLAAMLIFAVTVWFLPDRSTDIMTVAVLTDSAGAQWQGQDNLPMVGDVLYQGPMTLTRGFAEITFEKGAKVVLEGPASVELTDINKMILREGKLFAKVPTGAVGFAVDTPDASMIDLGTEFGAHVSAARSDLYVMDGKVALRAGSPAQTDTVRLQEIVTTGLARRVTAGGDRIQPITGSQEHFQRHIPLKHLVAYWNFDKDVSNIQGNSRFDGRVVGQNVSVSDEDCAVGVGALRVADDGQEPSYLAVDASPVVPRQEIYTAVAWYKYKDIGLDGSDVRNFIFETTPYWSMSFGILDGRGGKVAQWYVSSTRELAYRNEIEDGPLVDDGQWHHAAVIWNQTAGTIKYYHDGELLHTRAIGPRETLKFTDSFHIGYHRGYDSGTEGVKSRRNWDGYIDEVAVYDIELNATQVKALYDKSYSNQSIHAGNVLKFVN